MRTVLDVSVLISLGQIGELELLRNIETTTEDPSGVPSSSLGVPPAVADEVVSEPASSNLGRFIEASPLWCSPETYDVICSDTAQISAQGILGEDDIHEDIQVIALVENSRDTQRQIAVVSDDRRVRTVARNLGATVTGTIGVIVRSVEEREMSAEEGKDLVRRVDGHGLHMTGELREKAYELITEAATD